MQEPGPSVKSAVLSGLNKEVHMVMLSSNELHQMHRPSKAGLGRVGIRRRTAIIIIHGPQQQVGRFAWCRGIVEDNEAAALET